MTALAALRDPAQLTSALTRFSRRERWDSPHTHNPLLPLATVPHVHHAPELIERQMKPLLALDAVQRQVVIAASAGQEVELVRGLRGADATPGAVAEV